jgi:hypothetical protein
MNNSSSEMMVVMVEPEARFKNRRANKSCGLGDWQLNTLMSYMIIAQRSSSPDEPEPERAYFTQTRW